MQRPRPVFIVALTAAVVVSLLSLAAPSVAQALPRARAALPVAKKTLQDRVPEAARALGMERAAPAAAPEPEAPAPTASPPAPRAPTQELAGFSVPDFGAMARPQRAARLRLAERRGGAAAEAPAPISAPEFRRAQ